jgi:hypothetical protein
MERPYEALERVYHRKLCESRDLYRMHFKATILWEADWVVLLKISEYELGFLLPDQPSQALIFQRAFKGQGVWLTIEVPDVDAEHERLLQLGLPIIVSLRNEAWGDCHFSIVDPSRVLY